MQLHIEALGPLAVVDADRTPLPLQPKLQHALCLLIAAEGRWVTVDAIIEDFWPTKLPKSPRSALHTALSRLRTALGDSDHQVIESNEIAYRLNASSVTVDIWSWNGAVANARRAQTAGNASAVGQFATAAALWSGDPYLSISSSARLDTERQRLDVAHRGAVLSEARLLLEQGSAGAALTRLDACFSDHDGGEAGALIAMQALVELGRTPEAVGRAGRYRTDLREQLGLSPTREFEAAEHALLLPARPQRRPGPDSGRPSGTGQTHWRPSLVDRLTSEIVEYATAKPDATRATVWSITAPPDYGLSTLLGSIAEAVEASLPDVNVTLMRDTGGDYGLRPLLPAGSAAVGNDLGRLAHPISVIEQMAAAEPDRGRVVVIDDAQRLGAWSSDFLDALQIVQPKVKFLVVAGLHPRADDARTPGQLKAELGALTAFEIDGLLESTASVPVGAVRDRLVERIVKWCAGEPSSTADAVAAVARHGPNAELPIPTTRRERVDSAVARMNAVDSDLLSRVALISDGIDPLTVAGVLDVDLHIVLDVLDRSVDAGLVVHETRPGWWAFTDASIRTLLLQRVPPTETRRVHIAAGHWFQQQVIDWPAAAEHLVAALPAVDASVAQRAVLNAANDHVGAHEYAEAARSFAVVRSLGADDAIRLRTAVQEASALERSGQHLEGDILLGELVEELEAVDEPELLATAALGGAGLSSRIGGSKARRMRLSTALQCLPAGHVARDEVTAEFALEHVEEMQPLGDELAQDLAAIADRRDSPAYFLARRLVLALEEGSTGAPFEEVRRLIDDVLALGRDARPIDLASVLPLGCHVACTSGRWSQAHLWLTALEECGRRTGSPRALWQSKAMRAALLESQGRPGLADEEADAAAAVGQRLQVPDAAATRGLHDTGRMFRAGAMAPLAPLLQAAPPSYQRPALFALRSAAELDGGQERAALRSLETAVHMLEGPRSLHAPAELSLCCLMAVQLGRVELAIELATELRPRRGGHVFLGYGGPYLGPIDWYLGLVARLAGEDKLADELFTSALRLGEGSMQEVWQTSELRKRLVDQ